MQHAEYHKQYGATTACTLRLSEAVNHCGKKHSSRRQASQNEEQEEIHGDSWFASVKTAVQLADRGFEFIGPVKTNSTYFPKAELELMMKEWPSGSHAVLECETPTSKKHKLLAIGYKYNARKTLCFVATKNAGSTSPGKPYIARFPDSFGNLNQREVPRPQVISRYFETCNVIDVHNQARQYELALEKHWVTHSGWFRIITTVIGMTITDCWKGFRHASASKSHKEMSIVDFANRLSFDLIHNEETDNASQSFIPIDDGVPLSVDEVFHILGGTDLYGV